MHDGHRIRLRSRFLSEGLDGFEPHNVLELLLFFAIPRHDTNEIAHLLIKRFGSLSAVFDAPHEELKKIPGIGENAASLLKLIPDICRKYYDDKKDISNCLTTHDLLGAFLVPKFLGRKDEIVIIVCLDSKRKILHDEIIFEGNVNSTQVSIRKIVEIAIMFNSAAVVIAHNHPGGLSLPSAKDLSTTININNALKLVNIELADHIVVCEHDYIVVCEHDYISMKYMGFFNHMQAEQ